MPTKAKLYVGFVIVAAAALVAACVIAFRQFPDQPRYLLYLALALVASVLKVRLPGFTGTISVSFLFILIAVADFSLLETVLMACGGALIQCLWRPRRSPRAVQVGFNMAALGLSAAAAHVVSNAIPGLDGPGVAAMLALAATVYFLTNTLLVSEVICLSEDRSLTAVWQQCYLWSFPYYLVGAAIAGLITSVKAAVGWQASLLILPVMCLVYVFYRLYVARALQQPVAPELAMSGAGHREHA